MLPNDVRKLLTEVFTQGWEEGRRGNRLDKCEQLYQLGQEATDPIVELGAWRGCGCTTLALGAKAGNKVSVFAVDDYTPRLGAFNDPYGPNDRTFFVANTSGCKVNVGLLQKTSLEAAEDWVGPLGLVYWDLSHGDCLLDFSAWHDKISPGGRFAVGDTTGRLFASHMMRDIALSYGWTDLGRWGGFIYVVQK